MSELCVGIDLGGSKALACLVDSSGEVLGRWTQATGRATSPVEALAIIEVLVALAQRRSEALNGDAASLRGVGVGFPGLVDYPTGRVNGSVMLDGWSAVPLAAEVSRRCGLPCVVDNDVNAAAWAESCATPVEQRAESAVFIALGTGIGGALVLGGQVWRGASGSAGEVGNVVIEPDGDLCWCGRRGCLNTVASGSAIERRAGLAAGTLAAAWRAPTPQLRAVVRRAGEALGQAVTEVLHLLNPAEVVLGGGVAALGEALLGPCRAVVARESFAEAATATIRLSRVGYDAGAVGAALLAHGHSRAWPSAWPSASANGSTRAQARGATSGGPTFGPSSVGPSSVGPSSVVPSSVGPSSVGPSLVGPSSSRPWPSAARGEA